MMDSKQGSTRAGEKKGRERPTPSPSLFLTEIGDRMTGRVNGGNMEARSDRGGNKDVL